MESVHVGVQDALGQGARLRGLPRAAVLLALRDAAVEHRDPDGRRLPPAPGPRGHRRLQLETGEPLLVWTTTPWTLPSNLAVAVGPDIDYVVVELRRAPCRRAVRARRRPGWRTTPASSARRAPRSCARCKRRASCVGRAYTPLFDVLRRAARTRSGCSAADFVTTEDGTGVVHMAPAFGEDDKASRDAAGIEPVVPGRRAGPVHRRGARRTPGLQVFEANRPIVARPRTGRRAAPSCCATRPTTTRYPHCWRADNAAHLQGGLALVRQGHRDQGPDGRAQPADQLGARAHQGRLVRQVARERPRLVDQPQPVLGQPDPGVGERRPARTRGSTSTAASTSSSATSACARPTCTGPYVDELTRPEPRRPDRARRPCAGCPRCSTAGSSPARCRSPRCTTRSRTRTGSSTTTRATSSSSTSGRPAAGSTRCTCWPRRCSTGRRSAPASATASCWATTAAR